MFTKLFSVIAASSILFTSALAKTNFAGLNAANSVGNAGTYTCRTPQQWNTFANDAKKNGFGAIRILGFDCNALDLASAAAKSAGLKVMAGIYIDGTVASGSAQVDKDAGAFIDAYKKYGADRYLGLAVGNEVADSPANIMAKVNDVRNRMKSAGVKTPVSTVHVWVTIRDHPELCSADFVGANAHAFYDGGRTSAQAGEFLSTTVIPSLKKACPGKKIYITETGWPSAGPKNGVANASPGDEQTALGKLNCAARDSAGVSVFAFEYDDQKWKGNGNEQSFGIIGKFDLGKVLGQC
ncbi:glycoside hydrolase family 17 protein [Amanita thiersii Skay4041]|uniref:glucan endo-1,3-beta-D-glucosidase n=1 Tax=Amanita thiersii Skay4041 TaxID=703135 RepID=A0A2A9N8U2_9AGAR|nr:glycoside hydrolase family 17 protein [Amanita thiersii Skay4041]